MTWHLFDLEHPLISADNTWMLWTLCILGATAAILLEQKYRWAAKVTGTLIALLIAALLSNLGIIPMQSGVWDSVWDYIAPLCIPMLLLKCNVRCLGRDAGRVLTVFLIGSVGTALGAIAGYFLLRNSIPELGRLAGVFTGTYTGGAVNFTDICRTFAVPAETVSAATVADNSMMALYFIVLTWIPSVAFFRNRYDHPLIDDVEADSNAVYGDNTVYIPAYSAEDRISLKDVALTVSISIVIVSISHFLGNIFMDVIPQTNVLLKMLGALLSNEYVWISAISITCASLKPQFFGSIGGTNILGTFIIYIFFFVIGVPASVAGLINGSAILLLYALIVVAFNMLFCFVLGRLLGCSLEEIIIASNANIGGPTTAAAMAMTKGWSRLAGPAVIVGVLGYALGTYLGLVVGSILGI